MSDMMKKFVEQELECQIKKNYPHMQYPPCLYAKCNDGKGKGGTVRSCTQNT